MDREELKSALREILDEELGLRDAEIGGKWEGGELVIRSTRGAPREKVIPLETFFRKIVTVRERLRMIEQKINSHPTLSSEDKVSLQQYVTKIYGTLTTFNFLFRSREDHFVGERKAAPRPTPGPMFPTPDASPPPPAETFLG